MIPVIKTIARYGKFAGKEKYQGVLQHVRLYSIYGFHIKKNVLAIVTNTLHIFKDEVCLTDIYAIP